MAWTENFVLRMPFVVEREREGGREEREGGRERGRGRGRGGGRERGREGEGERERERGEERERLRRAFITRIVQGRFYGLDLKEMVVLELAKTRVEGLRQETWIYTRPPWLIAVSKRMLEFYLD